MPKKNKVTQEVNIKTPHIEIESGTSSAKIWTSTGVLALALLLGTILGLAAILT